MSHRWEMLRGDGGAQVGVGARADDRRRYLSQEACRKQIPGLQATVANGQDAGESQGEPCGSQEGSHWAWAWVVGSL